MSTPGSRRPTKLEDGRRKIPAAIMTYRVDPSGWSPEEHRRSAQYHPHPVSSFPARGYDFGSPPPSPLSPRTRSSGSFSEPRSPSQPGRRSTSTTSPISPSFPASPGSYGRQSFTSSYSGTAPGSYGGYHAVPRTPTHEASQKVAPFPQELRGQAPVSRVSPRPLRHIPQPKPHHHSRDSVPSSPGGVTNPRISMAMSQRALTASTPPLSPRTMYSPDPRQAARRYGGATTWYWKNLRDGHLLCFVLKTSTDMRCLWLPTFLSLFHLASAVLVNTTVDDTNGGPGSSHIIYQPDNGWLQGEIGGCDNCSFLPVRDIALMNTFHESAQFGQKQTNSSVCDPVILRQLCERQLHSPQYLYQPTVRRPVLRIFLEEGSQFRSGTSDLTFNIDGIQRGTFPHIPSGSQNFQLATVFISGPLDLSNHTMEIKNGRVGGPNSLMIPDSITFGFDDSSEPTATQDSSRSLPTQDSDAASSTSTPRPVASASVTKTSHNTHMVIIVSAIAAASAGTVVLMIAVRIYLRRARRLRAQYGDLSGAEASIHPFVTENGAAISISRAEYTPSNHDTLIGSMDAVLSKEMASIEPVQPVNVEEDVREDSQLAERRLTTSTATVSPVQTETGHPPPSYRTSGVPPSYKTRRTMTSVDS
ncbi:hypothetical protein R3P38DRAFT_3165811 [Favolaschia claudopus]|uniref:Uncharacterized protein n=1 Tax=Favolaschia claudopus TaxID=2862362 RepID=A0AAW0EL15_9AGAR